MFAGAARISDAPLPSRLFGFVVRSFVVRRSSSSSSAARPDRLAVQRESGERVRFVRALLSPPEPCIDSPRSGYAGRPRRLHRPKLTGERVLSEGRERGMG